MPRILRNLHINEVSMVDRGAGRHVDVKLWKRDEPEEADMTVTDNNTHIDLAKAEALDAHRIWRDAIAEVCKRNDVCESQAIDLLLRTEAGQQAFALAKSLTAADVLTKRDMASTDTGRSGRFSDQGGRVVSDTLDRPHSAPLDPALKMGSGDGLPQRGASLMDAQGGRVASPTARSGHGASSNQAANPHRGVRNDVDPDSVLPRIRNEHKSAEVKRYNSIVSAQVASGKSRSQAVQNALVECPLVRGMSAAEMIQHSVG
jgi:hypothetical protein